MGINENPLGLKLFSAECGKGKFDFLQIPLQLLTNPAFESLSYGAVILYGFILRRVNISIVNHEKYSDDNGNIYIIYQIDQICNDLNCSPKSAVKFLSSLETNGLVKKVKQGLTKPNVIYPYDFSTMPVQSLNCKKYNSGIVESTILELEKVQCSYIDNSNIDSSQINNINDGWIDRDEIEKIIKNNIGYNFIINHPIKGNNYYRQDILDEICTILIDTLCCNRPTIRISGSDLPAENVKDVLRQLNSFHIVTFLNNINNTYTEKLHLKDYVLTALYDIVKTENISALSQCKSAGTIP